MAVVEPKNLLRKVKLLFLSRFYAYAPIESENFLSMPDELIEKYLENSGSLRDFSERLRE